MTTRTGTDPWLRLARITAVTGLSSIVLLFATIIPLAALGEPPFTASNEEARAYLVNVSVGWPQTVIVLSSVAAIGILWFVVGLSLVLRRAEGDPPWRSTIALVSGVLLTAYTAMDASLDAASFRGADLDPAVAGYAFAVGSAGFANAWLALASFAVCAGWVGVATGIFGRWLGWWAIISGLGLALSRFFWTSEIWLLPYGLFWVWMIIVCVRLLGCRQPAYCAAMAAGWRSRSRMAGWSGSAAELKTGSIMAASDPRVCTAGRGSFIID